MPLTAEQRRIRSQIAAHQSWAHTPDRAARTRNARQALENRFIVEVIDAARARGEIGPGDGLPEHLLAPRVESARKAYFQRLALKSAKARAARKNGAAK